MNNTQNQTPLINYLPKNLRWREHIGKSELQEHFVKHKEDEGHCLKRSMPSDCSFDVAGYDEATHRVLASPRWIMHAKVRSLKGQFTNDHPHRHWYFASNLFCVLVSVGKKNDIVSAYHHHLYLGKKHHDEFEKQFSTDELRQDGFLDWLDQSETLSASASAIRGKALSHKIEDLIRIEGF
jgi:hypothetical protein